MPMESVFDLNWPQLSANGYFILPIGPGTKKPQRYTPSLDRYEDMTGWTNANLRPTTSAQPGAGIGIRLGKQLDGTYIVALDWDDDDVALEALDVFPETVTKEGQRGFTAFYRTTSEIPSRDFRV